MVIAGFEPLDILQSIWMLLRQIKEGRVEIENQYARVVPEAGNAPALRAVSRVYELREFFEWRGLGSIDHSGVRLRDAYARFDAERKFAIPNIRIADPKACQCGEVLKGVIKPVQCKVFGVGLHAGNAARRVDGFVRRRLRRLLSVWPAQAARGDRMNVAAPVRARSLGRVHVPTVTLAHGGGGKAMKDLIDDVFVRAFDNPLLAPLEDQARLDLADLKRRGDRLAFTTDFVRGRSARLSRRRHRHASQSAARSTISRSAAPSRFILSCAAIVEEGVTIDLLRQIAGVDGGDSARGGRRHRHRRHQGRRPRAPATSSFSPRPESASSAKASILARIARARATSSWSTACSATMARRSYARAATWRWRRRLRAIARRCTD